MKIKIKDTTREQRKKICKQQYDKGTMCTGCPLNQYDEHRNHTWCVKEVSNYKGKDYKYLINRYIDIEEEK